MTISSTSNRKEYAGNGSTTAFATSPVVFFDETDLEVYKVVTATGVATLQTLTTDYTVSGGSGSTGTVTAVVAPTSLETYVIVRTMPLTQAVDFVNNEATDAEVAEDALDKLTLIGQQLSAQIDRSFTLADSDVSGASTKIPTPAASKLIGWDPAGIALANYAASSIVDTIVPTAFAETLLDDTTAAGARATLDAQEDVLTTIGDSVVATTAGAAARLAAAATVAAHATTMNPWGARQVTLSGSAVTFTDMADAPYVGASVMLAMNAAHTFTDGAVFDVQGGANYTAASGDQVLLVATAVGAFDVTIFPAAARLGKQPTRQVLTSGTAATYTTPTGATRINVRMVGGGGGGGAADTNVGSAGNNTTFGALTAGGGGAGGTTQQIGGAGGSASGGDINIPGGSGQGGQKTGSDGQGGTGGSSVFGGAGGGGQSAGAGRAGATNSGSGGGGGGSAAGGSGAGGGAGGYVEKLIVSPSSTYTYTVGAAANGGAAGTQAGGNGAAGIIIVDEYYN